MRKKTFGVFLVFFSLTIILSGCSAKDISAGMIASDREKILGQWYDTESKGYFDFKDNGTFITGYGLHSENAGGFFELKDNQLVLTPTYSIFDGQRQDVKSEEQKVVTMNYRFNINDDLSIRGDNYNVLLSRVKEEKEMVQEEKNESQFNGLYKASEGTLFYYFDGNGVVNRSTNSNEKTYTGSYSVTNTEILMTFENKSDTYQFEFTNDHEFSLKDDSGKTTHYGLVDAK